MQRFSLSLKKVALATALTLLPIVSLSALLFVQVRRRLKFPTLQFDLPGEPWFIGLLLLALVVFASWSSWRVLGTSITPEGVRQPTFFGVSAISWNDASSFQLSQGNVLRISGPGGTVWIPCYLYANPLELLEFSFSRLRRPNGVTTAA